LPEILVYTHKATFTGRRRKEIHPLPVRASECLGFRRGGLMSNRLSVIFTAGLLIGLAGMTAQAQRGFGGPGFEFPGGGFGPGLGRVVTGEPYTATVTETSVEKLTNGTTITHNSTITEARDGDGRTYRSIATPSTGSSSPGFTRTTVTDPVAHTITEWSSQSTTATQIQLPDNPRGGRGAWAGGTPGQWAGGTGPGTAGPGGPRLGGPGPGGPGPGGPGPGGPGGFGPGGRGRSNAQVTRTTLPTQTIAGVSAEGEKTTITVPAGAEGNSQPLVSTREVWTSTDLKIVLLEKSDDGRDGLHKTEVTSLTPGAPDPTLFQVPQGYTVRTETRHRGN
jgi:hypothetical protein